MLRVRRLHRFDRAREFGEDGIACGIENAAAALGDEIVGHLTVGRQATQRLLFVLGNQSGVAGNIGRKNRRDLAFHEKQPRINTSIRNNAARSSHVQPSRLARKRVRGSIRG